MASQQTLTTSVATLGITPFNGPRTIPNSGDVSSSHTSQSSSHYQLRSSSSEIELGELSRVTPACNPASAQASQSIPGNDATIQGDPPQSILPAPSVEVSSMPPTSTNVISISAKACYQWLQTTLGIVTLILGLVSILVYNVRSYRLAIWTARNDEIQACTGMIQARPEQPVNSNCERLLSTGPQDPPYSLIKRGLQNFLMNKSATFVHGTPTLYGLAVWDETQTSVMLALALVFLAVFVADIGIAVLRGYSRTGEPFSSPVRLEMPDTWMQEEIGIPFVTTGVEYDFQDSQKRKGRLQEEAENFLEKEQKDLTSTLSNTDSEDEPGVTRWQKEKERERETESEEDESSRQNQLYPMMTTSSEGTREIEYGGYTNSNDEIPPIPTEDRLEDLHSSSSGGILQAIVRHKPRHKPRHPDPLYYAPGAAIPNDQSEAAGKRGRRARNRGTRAGEKEKGQKGSYTVERGIRVVERDRLPASKFLPDRKWRHSYKRNRKNSNEAMAKIPKGHTNPRSPKQTP